MEGMPALFRRQVLKHHAAPGVRLLCARQPGPPLLWAGVSASLTALQTDTRGNTIYTHEEVRPPSSDKQTHPFGENNKDTHRFMCQALF